MQKIPTLFQRDPNDRKHVLPEVNPGCEWVLEGEGFGTRQFDGMCVRLDEDAVWARREVKPGKPAPDGFEPVMTDPVAGKTQGWVPLDPFHDRWKAFEDAALTMLIPDRASGEITYINIKALAAVLGGPCTAELIGPSINGNPEGTVTHELVRHGRWRVDGAFAVEDVKAPRDFEGLQAWLLARPYEGIVWHHEDGRMAKLKRRDFA